jgi:hypothetical protein
MRVGLSIVVGCLVVVGGARVLAQEQATPRVMGTVATKDALVTGGLEVKGDRARLMSNASVTAYDHTAQVKLERGGEVLVCSTSQFHLLSVGAGNGADKALLFGLDRGALELHSPAETRDVILTPDIRFAVEAKGSYDLRVRVTRNGDTCVENAGKMAPVLVLHDAFSQASYRVMPGQHVMFEHGNLREVVDHERSPCGCPGSEEPEHVAENASAAQKAAAEHPFPAAASEGLAAAQPVANSPVGEKETQVSTSLSYGAGDGAPNAVRTPEQIIADAGDAPVAAPKMKRSFGYKFKHFFYRLFHPGGSS